MVNFKNKTTKTIINRMKYIDSWFWCRYTCNPYMGCEHACVYCDARSKRYYLHNDFDQTIYVKHKPEEILESKLKNSRKILPDVVAMAGTSDAYQPVELKYNNTRNILKILHKFKFPINISTKSIHIKKDLPLIHNIAENSWANIAFTITSVDQELTNFLEPKASSVVSRYEMIKYISKNYPKIHIGVNLMPIIPLLQDSKDSLEILIRKAKENGAEYINFSAGVTLNDSQGEYFIKKLKDFLKNLKKEDLFSKFVKDFGPKSKYNQKYYQRKNLEIYYLCKKYDLKINVPRWIPDDFRKNNYRAAEKLLNLAQIRKIHGKSYKELYWAGMNINNLKNSLGYLVAKNTIYKEIKMNAEIQDIIRLFIKKPMSIDKFL